MRQAGGRAMVVEFDPRAVYSRMPPSHRRTTESSAGAETPQSKATWQKSDSRSRDNGRLRDCKR